jgi:4-amino-4-deoxy-L-arabinose transferase-like glycosyltransferase
MQQGFGKQGFLDLTALFIGIFIFYFLFLGAHPLLTPDEAGYTEVSRGMLVNHSFWIPLLNGIPFFDKPPLFYWLQMSAMSVFGVSEWAARCPTAFLGTVTCLWLYGVGRVLFDRLTGLLSAIVLATSLFYFLMSHYANLDLSVAAFITASLSCFIIAMQFPKGRKATTLLLLAYFFSGLAVLTKGLIGIVFPAMIVGVWLLLTHQWFLWRRLHLGWGLLIVLLINGPWLFLVQKRHPEFWHYYFYIQQYSRFLGHQFNSKQPIWFYGPVILGGMLPWTLFLGQAMIQRVRRMGLRFKEHGNDLFLLLWPLLILIFFSIPASKTLGYILPALPPLAVLVACYLRQHWFDPAPSSWLFTFVGVLSCLLAVALLVFIQSLNPKIHITAYILCSVFIFLGVALCWRWRLAFRHGCMLLIAGFVLIMSLFMMDIRWLPISSAVPLLPTLKAYEAVGVTVVDYNRYDRDLPFYLGHPTVIVGEWDRAELLERDSWQGVFAYANQYQRYPRLWIFTQFFREFNSQRPLIVVLNKRFLPVFQTQNLAHGQIVQIFKEKVLLVNPAAYLKFRQNLALPPISP